MTRPFFSTPRPYTPTTASTMVQPGVSMHVERITPAQLPLELGLVKRSGFNLVRTDLLWSQIERQPGVYDFSAYDGVIRTMRQQGLKPWLILGGNNPLYTPPPSTGESRGLTRTAEIQAFCRFVDAVTRHYAGQGIVWELWNEPNHPLFWQPRPNASQYIRLAKAVLPVMRQNDPSGMVIAPSTSGSPVDFITQCLDAGLLNWADGISIHPYQAFYPKPSVNRPPEAAIPEIMAIRQLLQARGLSHKHLMLGEWGYSTADASPEQQAVWAARQYLVALFCQNPANIWYDWKDDGPNPTEKEDRFGMRRQDLIPKPAQSAVSHVIEALQGFHYVSRLPVSSNHDYAWVFENAAGHRRVALWTTGPSHNVTAWSNGPVVKLTGMPHVITA